MNAPKPSDISIAPKKGVALRADLTDAQLESIAKTSPDPQERDLANQRLSARHLVPSAPLE